MHKSLTDNHLCRVCGLYQADAPWDEDGKAPSFEICDCCGVEFGYEDVLPESVVKYREAWIKRGCNWFNKKKRPPNWDFTQQLAQIGYHQKGEKGS